MLRHPASSTRGKTRSKAGTCDDVSTSFLDDHVSMRMRIPATLLAGT